MKVIEFPNKEMQKSKCHLKRNIIKIEVGKVSNEDIKVQKSGIYQIVCELCTKSKR